MAPNKGSSDGPRKPGRAHAVLDGEPSRHQDRSSCSTNGGGAELPARDRPDPTRRAPEDDRGGEHAEGFRRGHGRGARRPHE